MSILTVLELLPLLGTIFIAFIPKSQNRVIKQIAFAISLVVAAVSLSLIHI